MLLVFFVVKKLSNYPGTSLLMTTQYLLSLAHFASISLRDKGGPSIKVLVTFAFLCLWIDCTSGLIEDHKEQASLPL
jgi:hypothetical protein